MVRPSLLLFPLFLTMQARSQNGVDSTRYVFHGDLRVSGMGGLMLQWGSLGVSNGTFSGVGGGGGLLIDQRLMVGGYGQGLTNAFIHEDFVQNGRSYEATLTFGHGGIWAMYSFAPKRPVHLFASIQAGWGAAQWQFNDPDDTDEGNVPDSLRVPDNIHDRVMVFTPSVGVEFNVLRWFRPNVYVGYRSVIGLDLPQMGSNDLDGFLVGANLLFGGFGDRR